MQPIIEISEKPGVEVYRYWDDRKQSVFASNPNLPGIVYVLKGKEAIFAITRDRKSTRLNSSHIPLSRMPSSA